MAQKKKSPSQGKKEADESTKVTRIKATDTRSAPTKKTGEKKSLSKDTVKSTDQPKQAKKTESKNPIKALGGYFKGAWQELRQVHWPNRRTTWGLTLAVILFTAFFVVLVVLLDYAFQWIFDKVLLG